MLRAKSLNISPVAGARADAIASWTVGRWALAAVALSAVLQPEIWHINIPTTDFTHLIEQNAFSTSVKGRKQLFNPREHGRV